MIDPGTKVARRWPARFWADCITRNNHTAAPSDPKSYLSHRDQIQIALICRGAQDVPMLARARPAMAQITNVGKSALPVAGSKGRKPPASVHWALV